MENLYNAVLTFKGEGSFTFILPGYGETTIYPGRNIFVKGLTVNGVEALRELKPLLLEHKLNGKSDGCYKVIDLTTLNNTPSVIKSTVKNEVKSVADLKAEMIKSNGPIIEDEIVKSKVEDEVTEEPKVEDEVVEPKPVKKTTRKINRRKSK